MSQFFYWKLILLLFILGLGVIGIIPCLVHMEIGCCHGRKDMFRYKVDYNICPHCEVELLAEQEEGLLHWDDQCGMVPFYRSVFFLIVSKFKDDGLGGVGGGGVLK